MANEQMVLVSTITVGSGGASAMEFTSIPQTATDLVLIISSRTSNAAVNDSVAVQFNNSTTGYTNTNLYAYTSSVSSNTNAYPIRDVGATALANVFSNSTIYIPNYAGSANKTMSCDSVGENNVNTADRQICSQAWASTAAITSVKLIPTASYVQYSTASLYTITKGSGGATAA